MITIQARIVLLGIVAWLALPQTAKAIPAITCHCFTDRSYDAAHPAAADPYFLATTQNAFFAAVFNTDKKTVVMKKQRGASSDDLWVAYWVASRAGMSAESLLQAKIEKETWSDVLSPLRLTRKMLGTRFSAALDARGSSTRLAEAAVDDVLVQYRLLDNGELMAMRKAGVSNQEVIIATVIAARTGQPARLICIEIRKGARTWGSFLDGAKIDAKDIPQVIALMLRSPAR